VHLILTALLLSMASPSAGQDNWHQFRGPTGNGVAPKATPPTTWSEEKNIKWKVEIPGKGHATPIVWDDKIFILTAVPTKKVEPRKGGANRFGVRPQTHIYQYVVLCLERDTGKTLWKRVAAEELPHEGMHNTSSNASPTPVTDGTFLYASFGSAGIFCYDFKGTLKWKRDLGDLNIEDEFGEGTSPVLHGDSLVHLWDHEGQSYLYCLDAKTGKDKWKVQRDEGTTWHTPLIVEHEGVMQVVVNGKERSRGYALETGKVLWECGGQISTPLTSPVSANGVVYFSTGFGKSAIVAVPLDARGDITDSDKVLWTNQDAAPYVASPLLYDGLLYVTKQRTSILACLDAKTGKAHYSKQRLRRLRNLHASIAGADGKVFIVGGKGTTFVLKHGKEFEVLATNKLDDAFSASPVLVGSQIFLRGKKYLYCIEE